MKEADPYKHLFENIEKVDVPPFLFSRIEARIQALKDVNIQPRWIWATGLAFAVVLALNILVISKSTPSISQNTDLEIFSNSLQMNSSNQLYNEQN